jgi:4-hydroxybenzoate polyprenyltransferase
VNESVLPVAGHRSAAGLVELVRIRACLGGAASVLLGAFLARGVAGLTERNCLAGSVAIALAVAVANVVNDIADLPTDAASGRARPLPSGRVRVPTARVAAVALGATALGLAATAGLVSWLAMGALLLLATAYSLLFKSTVLVGNLVVAGCASSPVVYGGFLAGSVTPAIWVAAGLSFLFMLAYEALKTLRDGEPDAAAGLRTLATWTGPAWSVRLFAACSIVLGAALLAASAVSPATLPYLVCVLPLLALIGAAAAPFVRRPWARTRWARPADAAIERSLRLLKVAWLVGLIDMTWLR